jgi:hypothetical protein
MLEGGPQDSGAGFGTLGDATTATCKAGLYTGTFTGTYASSAAFGIPASVGGNISMTLQQNASGGEVSVYAIENGSLSGLANGKVPFYCSLVGTVDCASKKLVGGTLDCTYCVEGTLADGGSCSQRGHPRGTLDGNYDLATYSFVDGRWNVSEELIDGGAILNEAGAYGGLGDYGGSGTWKDTSNNGDP